MGQTGRPTRPGGFVDQSSDAALRAAGLDVPQVLAKNDAYHALQKIGGLLMTGPTGTNVNDLAMVLIWR